MMFQQPTQSFDERVSHLEKTLPSLARLAEQQVLFESMQEMKTQLEITSKNLGDVASQISSLSSTLQALVKEQIEKMKAVQAAQDLTDQRLANEKIVSERIGSECLNAHGILDQQISLLDLGLKELKSLFAQVPTRNDFNTLNGDLQAKFKEPIMHLADLQVQMQEFTGITDAICNKLNKLSLDIQATQATIDYLGKQQKNGEEALCDKLEAAIIKQDGKITELGQNFDALVNKLKLIPVIDEQALKSDLVGLMEPIKIEANIAGLRSNNNLGKITVLEKKVEQLYLLLNK